MLSMIHGGDLPTAGKHMRRETPKESTAVHQKEQSAWRPPVQLVTATEGTGVEELIEKIQKHKTHLQESGLWQVKEAHRLRRDIEALIRESLVRQWEQTIDNNKFEMVLEKVIERKIAPVEAVRLLL
jgi:LAO/AO transport system kinase